MATPTLDEIEARARLLEPGCGVQGTAFLSDLLLALVSHVRALEEKVAALEFNELEATELVAEDAAFAKTVADRALEMDRLRAENAAQSKALEEALLLGKDALFAAQAREQKLAEENAELRKRVEALIDVPEPAPQWPAPQLMAKQPRRRCQWCGERRVLRWCMLESLWMCRACGGSGWRR